MASLTERVRRGAALLDRKVPGWERIVKITKLRMSDCNNCVLGQIFKQFYSGTDAMFRPRGAVGSMGDRLTTAITEAPPYGFMADASFADSRYDVSEEAAELRRLQRLWIAEIRKRRQRKERKRGSNSTRTCRPRR